MTRVNIQRLTQDIPVPSYAHAHDAAFDLHATEALTLQPMERQIVKTGIKLAIPEGHVGLIWDRSGLAAKHSLHVLAGVVDAGYRGEVGVVLINLGKESFAVEPGMRIAQMLIQPVAHAQLVEVEALDETSRGAGGFGSTGTH